MPGERELQRIPESVVFRSTARITGEEQVLGVPPALEKLSAVDFLAALPWEPAPADPERMNAEEFLLAL